MSFLPFNFICVYIVFREVLLELTFVGILNFYTLVEIN